MVVEYSVAPVPSRNEQVMAVEVAAHDNTPVDALLNWLMAARVVARGTGDTPDTTETMTHK